MTDDVEAQSLVPFCSRLAATWLAERPSARHRRIEGTLVPADLSGFTALSERLAAQGKQGAEQLTALVNDCFSALIDSAAVHGGDVLKFGGDALLLWFDGDDHASRAVQAAHGMQRALGAARFNRVGLRMSVGVHSDTFDLHLVGDETHRELVLTGDAVTTAVRLEAEADAGQVLVSPETSALDRAGTATLRDAVDPPSKALHQLIPPVLRADLNALAAVGGEHRIATVVFAQSGEGDPSSVDRLVVAVQEAAARYGAVFLYTDVADDGIKLIAVAGAPATTGQDEEAALRFALDLAAGQGLKVGVNRGRVFAGFLGGPTRRTYTVMGDAVNLSARLMSRARPGEVLAAAEVLRASRATFEAEPVEPFLVKGKTLPVEASIVTAAHDVRREGGSPDLPLVGRDAELAVMQAVVAEVASGTGRVVEIVGPAGIGKTRLVEAVATDPRIERDVWVTCQPYDVLRPYAAARTLLRGVFGISADATGVAAGDVLRSWSVNHPESASLLPLVADVIGADVPPTPESQAIGAEFRAARTQDAIVDVLGQALTKPTLLVLEDVYFVDDASRQVFEAVGERLAGRPWLFVVTRRPDSLTIGTPDATTTLELDGLDPADTRRLTELASGDRFVAAGDSHKLADRSGGNPLFVVELVAASAAGAALDDLPESVEQLVARNVDRLDPADRLLLRDAAVVGSTFDVNLLSDALRSLGEPIVDPLAFERMGELVEPAEARRYRFRHALYRDVAYEGSAYRRRRALHAVLGELLEQRPDADPALLSQHFQLGGDYRRAWRHGVEATRRARVLLAHAEVVACAERALASRRLVRGISDDDVAEVLDWTAVSLRSLGRADDARRLVERGLRMRGLSLERRAGLLRNRAMWHLWQGQLGLARRRLLEVRRLVDSRALPESPVLASILEAQTHLAFIAGDQHAVRRHGLETVGVAERTGDRASAGGAHLLLMVAATNNADDAVTEHARAAISHFDALGDQASLALVHNNLGANAYFRGRWDDAAQHYRETVERSERAGDVRSAMLGRNNLAEVLADQGHWHEALEQFVVAVKGLKSVGYKYGELAALGNVGRTLARLGRDEEAMRTLHEALAGLEELGSIDFVLETRARIAEAHALAHRSEEAEGAAESVLDAIAAGADVQPTSEPVARRAQGWARLQTGDAERALDAFRASVRVANQANLFAEEVFSLAALAVAARGVEDPHADGYQAEAEWGMQRLGIVSVAETAGGVEPRS